MKLKVNAMYLGIQKLLSKDKTKTYNVLCLLDKDDNTTYKIFIDDVKALKFDSYKLYNNYDFDLVLYLNQKTNLLNLGVV